MRNFTQTLKFLFLACALTLAANAWALDEYATVTENFSTTFSGNNLNNISNGIFTRTANRVKFSINNIDRYSNERLVYDDQAKNSTAYSTFSWSTTDEKYSVAVTGIEMQVRAYSVVAYSASAYFENNTPEVSCGTNSTGKGGAKKVSASSGLSGNSIRLVMKNKSSGLLGGTVAFTLHDIKFTYAVSHKEYLFGFEAEAIPNYNTYGTTTASVANSTIQAEIGVMSASTKATYKATPKEGYRFIGWYENSAMTGDPISSAYTYEKTLNNNTPGSIVKGTLYAKFAPKLDQEIIWPLADETTDPTTEYTTGLVMGATATSGLAVRYTSSDENIAKIVDGKLYVVTPNEEVTIYADVDATDIYNAAPTRQVTFTTAGATPDSWSVTASSIDYGDLLGESKFDLDVSYVYVNGVAIAGSFSWVNPAIMPEATQTTPESFDALFTPSEPAYSSITFPVPVTVNKAEPTITWNIPDILREGVRYSNFVESSNKEPGGDLSFDTSNADLLKIADGVLTTGGVSSIQGGWIKIQQSATKNYKEYNASWTLQYNVDVYPKNDNGACLPFYPMTESDYDNALVAITEPGGWCNTDAEGFHDDYVANIDVLYSQAKGIALGSYTEGLSGLTDAIGYYITHPFSWSDYEFAYSPKSVEFSFSGIPDQISFDVESQAVTSRGYLWWFTEWKNIDVTWPATAKNWDLYESADGVSYTPVGSSFTSDDGGVTRSLKENTRFIKIVYSGNFTGFVKNLRITRKKSLTADKSELTFGTEDHPLQEPQTITLSYSSLGVCGGMEDAITVTSSKPEVFYVDETTITENVGIEQKGSYTVRVRCNDVHQSGTITFTANVGPDEEIVLNIPVRSNNPTPEITATASAIFQTGTEHAPGSEPYRAQRTLLTSDVLTGLFDGSTPSFDYLYIYGVSESAADSRAWEYSPAKGYKVPVVTSSNVHTPCFVYENNGTKYTYVRTFDAATTTLNVANNKTHVFVGYRPAGPATTAIQLETGEAINLNNTEIVATNAAVAVNGNATVSARGTNIVSSTSKAAVQLSGSTTLTIADSWIYDVEKRSGILALRPAADYPSIDLGSATGRVVINGTQLELHNADKMAIAHMDGTEELFDGEVQINDGSIGGAAILGMPKRTFIDGGTFNDGTVAAYTLKGKPKRPRNKFGDMLSRQTMTLEALVAGYGEWYRHDHLTLDGEAKVNPMLMDPEVWIFNGDAGESYNSKGSWNKGAVPGEDDDVLINAPMVISGGELPVHSITINWENKGKGIPAVTINPNGGLTVGEDGYDALKVADPINNLVLKADSAKKSTTKGQTGFLRIHPESAEPMPKATIELYSIGYYDRDHATDDTNTAAWQCLGAPIEDAHVFAKSVYTQSWVYSWDENRNEWVNNRKNLEFEPFKGFETTQYKSVGGVLLTYTGQLVSGTEPRTIPLAVSAEEKGYNLLANSYTAPMVISQFQNTDFVNAESTIYILNAGTKDQSDNPDASKDAAGKFIGVPINLSPEALAAAGYPTIVPSMQGFWVKAIKPGETAQLTLDYSRLVWDQTYEEAKATKPLRAPKSQEVTEDPISGTLKVTIQANGWIDYIYLLESENFDTAYEDGYDAHRVPSGDMDIFTIEDNDYLGLDATNSIIGTRVGVRTGGETEYTFRFSHIQNENDMALWDKEAKMKVYINEDVEYTFYAVPNSTITDRFEIVAVNVPTVTTGVDEIQNETHIQKFIKDNQLYILKDGVLYNASGAVVRK